MPIKLTASVGKKVPDELEYSSKSYHASAEIECSSDLSAEQLNTQLHTLYSRLEQAIDEKINGKVTRIPQQGRQRRQRTPEGPASQKQTASQKQVSYLLDLATARNVLLPQLNAEVQQQFGVESIYQLDRKACSQMIDRMQQQKAA